VQHRFQNPLFADKALGLQIVKQAAELPGLALMRGQLAFEFESRVFSSRQ
jgi:hypothetical protein